MEEMEGGDLRNGDMTWCVWSMCCHRGTVHGFVNGMVPFLYTIRDPQSSVSTVSLAIGVTPRDTQLLDWTGINLTGSASVNVAILNGIPAWVKLMATNQGMPELSS